MTWKFWLTWGEWRAAFGRDRYALYARLGPLNLCWKSREFWKQHLTQSEIMLAEWLSKP